MTDVSVCVLTYNPVKEKLKETLLSIIRQKKIEFEIIVSDDGSEENLFEYVIDVFREKKFTNYKLVANEKNEGTVINCYRAVKNSVGDYIKTISPGDELYSDTTLYEWVIKLKESDYQWSFSDVICYKIGNDGRKKILSLRAHPQEIRSYKKEYKNQDKCRWNYLVLNDIPIGAAILIEKNLMLNYLKMIRGKVVYAEDHIFRLMMFDGICPLYYNSESIWYEYGAGISTLKNAVWEMRLSIDWNVADSIMLNRVQNFSSLQIKMRKAINSKYYKHKYISLIMVKGKLLFVIKRRLHPRMVR